MNEFLGRCHTKGRFGKPRRRERATWRGVAIHNRLIKKGIWIASRHAAARLAAEDFVWNEKNTFADLP